MPPAKAAAPADPPAPADSPNPAAQKAASKAAQTKDRVVTVTSISDPGAQADRMQTLYEQLSAARRDVGEKPLDYERFTAVVQAQVKKLGEGGRDVAFKLTVKGGRVTLTANKEDET